MSGLQHTQEDLQGIAQEMVMKALAAGAESCVVKVAESWGFNVSVRLREVDKIVHHQGCVIDITAMVGQRRGHATSNEISPSAMREAINQALSIAKLTSADSCAGLPDPELLCRENSDLSLFHPWSLTVEQAIERARRCENAGLDVSPQINKSEGANLVTGHRGIALANSLGFCQARLSTRHSLGLTLIAAKAKEMQQGSWHVQHRNPKKMARPEDVGQYAALRALSRLGSRQIRTCRTPVIFEAPVAASLIRHFIHAATGSSLYRRASFLANRLGETLFSSHFNIYEDPHQLQGLGSAIFDDDGVATHPRYVVQDGVLCGYFLSVYSGRKLGIQSTGNAGGSHNLIVSSQEIDLTQMIRHMQRGLLVTSVLGQGVNIVTGDYSQGVAGYWVENGKIAFPVQGITLAGNLRSMFRGMLVVGNDCVIRHSIQTGSVLIEEMTVGGAP